MKKIVFLILAAVLTISVGGESFAQKAKKAETVLFETNIHCNNCKKRIEDSLPFEKGVKDVVIDVEAKTVTVAYDTSKTDMLKLKKAIEKLGYEVSGTKVVKKE